MNDKTLPLSGGWVMITRKLPTSISPPLLSMFWATPDAVYEEGSFELSQWLQQRGYRASELMQLWRYRRGGKLTPSEIEAAKKLDAVEPSIVLEQRVHIVTEDGDVIVNPYEWVPVGDVSPFFAMIGEHIKLHMLGGMEVQGKTKDMIFYMQQRGIPKVEAYQLLLGTIRKPNICWLEPHEAYAEQLLGERPKKRTSRAPMKVEIVNKLQGA